MPSDAPLSGLHIFRGTNVRYCARVRLAGYRRWRVVKSWTRSRKLAFRALADAMESGHWKRGQVLLIADYYDPTVDAEMVR